MLLTGDPPSIVDGQSFNVLTSSDVDTVVGTVEAVDNEDDPLTYEIVAGDGAFKINQETGEISVANKSLVNSLVSPVTLHVRVSETATPANLDDADVTINLNRVPIINDVTFAVPPPIEDGVTVGMVAGTDPDDQTLTYFIIEGNNSGAFTINNSSGIITIANKDVFNQMTFPVALTVEARDSVSGAAQGRDTAIVTVTLDGPPVGDGKVVFSFSEESITYDISKNDSPLRLDPKALFSLDPTVPDNFAGAKLTVKLQGVIHRLNKGKLFVVADEPGDGRISLTGKSILYGNKVIGTFDRGEAGRHSLVITFSEAAKAKSVEALVRRIGITSRTPTGPRQVSLTFSGIPGLPGVEFGRSKTVYVVE